MSDDFDPYKPPTAEELQRAADVIVKVSTTQRSSAALMRFRR